MILRIYSSGPFRWVMRDLDQDHGITGCAILTVSVWSEVRSEMEISSGRGDVSFNQSRAAITGRLLAGSEETISFVPLRPNDSPYLPLCSLGVRSEPADLSPRLELRGFHQQVPVSVRRSYPPLFTSSHSASRFYHFIPVYRALSECCAVALLADTMSILAGTLSAFIFDQNGDTSEYASEKVTEFESD